MSHNKTKVGDSTPNRQGEVTLNLTDLSDVSNTPATDNFLKYDGSEWASVAGSSIASVEFIFAGRGESSAYSNSPHGTGAFTATDDLYIYDTSPLNTITGATISTTNDWINSITLPAGNYLINAQTALEFSASGYASYGFYNSSNTRVSQLGVIGETRNTGGGGSVAYSVLELSAQETIRLRMYAIGGTIDTGTNQGNTPSEGGIIVIEKLG